MGEYSGLPGVKGGTIKPRGKHMARTVSGLMAILRKGRICSSAADCGAVTVWKDDKGAYRCEFDRHRVPFNEATFDTKAAVRRWLKEWLPQTLKSPGDSRG